MHKKENKLYVLNVGDYIDTDLVASFEEEYECTVVYTEVNSNEEIYQKLKNENYDICVVSDYMIHRMKKEDLIINLKDIIPEYIPNYKYDDLFDDAKELMEKDPKLAIEKAVKGQKNVCSYSELFCILSGFSDSCFTLL